MIESNVEERGLELLQRLGLNRLEAEVYALLLTREPVTAYRVGKLLGRPTANVYKAMESLARQGAVLVEEGESRLCRAVPVDEFLGHLEKSWLGTTGEARKLLSALQKDSFDERVYRVESVDEVLARAAAMLASATQVAVIDAFPQSLATLRPDIEAAAGRGVELYVEAYAPIDIEGAEVVQVPRGSESVAAWRAEQLNLVVDGRELLLALLAADFRRVHHAIWSRSVYLACIVHSGRLCEQTVVRLLASSEADPSGGGLPTILERHRLFRNAEIPGHRELLRRFVDPEETTP